MSFPNDDAEAVLLDRLQRAMEVLDRPEIEAIFADRDVFTPIMVWRPDDADLLDPDLRPLLAYWNRIRGAARMPRHDQVDPVEMRELLGFLMLLDVVDDGADFRYRLYGSKVADRVGFDMTGKRVSEFSINRTAPLFFLACYRAAVRRAEPLKTIHQAAPCVSVTRWTRLILPLCDATGRVSRLLVANIPDQWRQPE